MEKARRILALTLVLFMLCTSFDYRSIEAQASELETESVSEEVQGEIELENDEEADVEGEKKDEAKGIIEGEEEEPENNFDYEEWLSDEDIVLNSLSEKKDATVTFQGYGDETYSVNIPIGTKIGGKYPTFEGPEHKVFSGWYTDKDGDNVKEDTEITNISEYVVEEDVTFYAGFEDCYVVTFHSNKPGVLLDGKDEVIKVKVVKGEPLRYSSDGNEAESMYDMPSVEPCIVDGQMPLSYRSRNTIFATNPEGSGERYFSNWSNTSRYYVENGVAYIYSLGPKGFIPKSDMDFYAVWRKPIKVTFDAGEEYFDTNSYEWLDEKEKSFIEISQDSKKIVVTVPEEMLFENISDKISSFTSFYESYDDGSYSNRYINNWYYDSEYRHSVYNKAVINQNNIVFYGKWKYSHSGTGENPEEPEKRTIVFNAGEGYFGDPDNTIITEDFYYNSISITMPTSVDSNKAFNGWYRDPECTQLYAKGYQNKYSGDIRFYMTEDVSVLYAGYDIAKTIKLNANGGYFDNSENRTNNPSEETKSNTVLTARESICGLGINLTLYEKRLRKDGNKIFAGWYTDAACTNKANIRICDTEEDYINPENDEVELFAKWKKAKSTKLTLEEPEEIHLNVGETYQLKLNVEGDDATDVRWHMYVDIYGPDNSSQKSIELSTSGQVKALGDSRVIVYAELNGEVSDYGIITVGSIGLYKPISLNPSELVISSASDEEYKVTATLNEYLKDSDISWTSGDENIATVVPDEDDKCVARIIPNPNILEPSTTNIRARVVGMDSSAICKLTVCPAEQLKAPKANIKSGTVEKGTKIVLSSDSYLADIYYTLDGTTPTLDSNHYDDAIVITDDVTIKAFAYKKGYTPSEVESFTYKVNKEDWGDVGDDVKRFFKDASDVPSGMWYIVDGVKYTDNRELTVEEVYTGLPITFNDRICVYHGTTKLLENQDYKISYQNNILAASTESVKAPTVTITGKSNYAGKAVFKFGILRASLEEAELSSPENVPIYAGRTVRLSNTKPTYTFNGKKLTLNKDYTLSYYKETEEGFTGIENPAKEFVKNVGDIYHIKAYAVEKEDCNFIGEVINEVLVVSIDKATTVSVSGLKVVDAKGKAIVVPYREDEDYDLAMMFDNSYDDNEELRAFVKDGRKTLVYGRDYIVEPVEGMDYHTSGIQQFRIVGLDGMQLSEDDIAAKIKAYTGSQIASFTIKGATFNDKTVRIAGLLTSVEYTGNEVSYEDLFNDKDKVAVAEDWLQPTLYITKKVGRVAYNEPLTLDEDYTISMKNNGQVGNFILEYKGINGYNGTIKKTLKIVPYDLGKNNADKLSIAIGNSEYSKTGAKPVPTVKFGDVVLKEGRDYTLSYKNNNKIVEDADALATLKPSTRPAVVVKGKNNFSGSDSSTYFCIKKPDISRVKLVVNDVTYNKKGKSGYFISKLSLQDDGRAISIGKNKDIEKITNASYRYTYAEDTVLATGEEKKAGDEIVKTDKVLPDTVIKVAVIVNCSAKSCYKSKEDGTEIVGYYRIINSGKNISAYTVKVDISNLNYNQGREIVPSKKDITMFYKEKGKPVYLSANDYDIVSVMNNRYIGKATIVLNGKGQYGGTKTVQFNIKAKGL